MFNIHVTRRPANKHPKKITPPVGQTRWSGDATTSLAVKRSKSTHHENAGGTDPGRPENVGSHCPRVIQNPAGVRHGDSRPSVRTSGRGNPQWACGGDNLGNTNKIIPVNVRNPYRHSNPFASTIFGLRSDGVWYVPTDIKHTDKTKSEEAKNIELFLGWGLDGGPGETGGGFPKLRGYVMKRRRWWELRLLRFLTRVRMCPIVIDIHWVDRNGEYVIRGWPTRIDNGDLIPRNVAGRRRLTSIIGTKSWSWNGHYTIVADWESL